MNGRVVGATCVGYPIWASWLGRRLMRSIGEPERLHLVVTLEESSRV